MSLALEEVRRFAPSVFAEQPYRNVSQKYTFIPTTRVLDVLRDQGWNPAFAKECRTRLANRIGYTKHMVRFRHPDFRLGGGDYIEILLINSHDTESAFIFCAGLFRLICENGAVIMDANFGSIRLRHTGFRDQQVLDVINRVIGVVPSVHKRIEQFKTLELEPPEQRALATMAMGLRYGEEVKKWPHESSRLLEVRRPEDAKPTMWNIFNRVQENVMKGGIDYQRLNHRHATTRPIKAITADIQINQGLWSAAARMVDGKLALAV